MIKLQFLGTGGLGSARIRNKLSREYRRFSTLLIDERIIIDPSEDIFEFEESFMLSGMLREIREAFITHSHLDHFSVSAIERLASLTSKRLRVFAEEALREDIESISGLEFVPISPLSLIRLEGYNVLPLPANHSTDLPSEVALNFLIEKEGKTLLYGIDGAFINPEAWRVLNELHLDAVILDCALADAPYSAESVNHNNLAMAATVKEIMTARGTADEGTKFILSHIPTNKKRLMHDELTEAAKEFSFKVAYDGYFIGI